MGCATQEQGWAGGNTRAHQSLYRVGWMGSRSRWASSSILALMQLGLRCQNVFFSRMSGCALHQSRAIHFQADSDCRHVPTNSRNGTVGAYISQVKSKLPADSTFALFVTSYNNQRSQCKAGLRGVHSNLIQQSQPCLEVSEAEDVRNSSLHDLTSKMVSTQCNSHTSANYASHRSRREAGEGDDAPSRCNYFQGTSVT